MSNQWTLVRTAYLFLLGSLSSTSTSNADITHLRIVLTPNIVQFMRTRLSLGLHVDFGSRNFRSRPIFGNHDVITLKLLIQ